MTPILGIPTGAWRLLVALWLLFGGAAIGAESNYSAPAPVASHADRVEKFHAEPGSLAIRSLRLDLVDAAAITVAKHANSVDGTKRLQIGVGRDIAPSPDRSSAWLVWERVPGGVAAHWQVTSPAAAALRVGLVASRLSPAAELRFAGAGGMGTVYGAFTARDAVNGDPVFWSPVLEGETALVEIFVADWGTPRDVEITLAQVSHLFASPADADAERLAKDGSQFCERDLICLSATNAALANTGRAVARMTYMDGASSYLCTGTLLNPIGGSYVPYFYSANHCIGTQPAANTLTTHWFYDRTGCGAGTTSTSYVQLTGGATLLFNNSTSDVSFMRLNAAPPTGAWFAGWTATTATTGTATTAVHHPAGDWKKVSLGTIGGFSAYGGGAGSTHIIALWNSTATGVTEGGSSGSGLFTAVGAPATDYQLRGGLHGGPSSCSATGTALRDYYSRFDQAYPSISQYLNPTTSCAYSLSPTGQSVGAPASTGSFTVTTTAGCTWTATSNAGWITTSSSGSGSGTVLYSVATNTGVARIGTITAGGQTFTISQAAAAAGTSRLVNISTRGLVLTGDSVMIGGFIIGGSAPKKVLVRARGPSMSAAGVSGVLSDPIVTLVSGSTILATNDDWTTNANASEISGTGFAPTDGLESAVLVTLSPGPYTAVVSGYNSAVGVGIVEVFEVDTPVTPLTNISTRGVVLSGDNVMIGGFIIEGNAPRTVIVRARGPSLTAAGVAGALSDPVLTLVSGSTVIAISDDWTTSADYAAILASGIAPTNGLESAILVTLSPGPYTAVVSGYNGATGVGIVEVFAQ